MPLSSCPQLLRNPLPPPLHSMTPTESIVEDAALEWFGEMGSKRVKSEIGRVKFRGPFPISLLTLHSFSCEAIRRPAGAGPAIPEEARAVERGGARIQTGGHAMNCHSPAPRGHDVKARGNALGTAREIGQALKGRNLASSAGGWVSSPHDSAPSGLGMFGASRTQGVALGCHIAPRWGMKPLAIVLEPGGASNWEEHNP
jgi:hypothetical protein